MIEVSGIEGSREYAVALALRDRFVEQWPGLDTSPADEEIVHIKANARLAGYPVSDVDIVVGAQFNRARYFVIRKPIKDSDGRGAMGAKARVHGFICAIEVKSQDSGGVSVSGDEVSVRYKEGWKSATEQNDKQLYSLGQYFRDQHLDTWVFRCLVLDGIDALPSAGGVARPEAGAVAHGFKAGDVLAAMAGVNGIRRGREGYYLSSGDKAIVRKALDAPLFRSIVPSRLDRIRMDRLASRRDEAVRLAALLGNKRVHVRGHGGTGKTVLMLQAAHEAYQRHGRRCLVLTYNLALAADISRLLALLGVPSTSDGGGIEVRPAVSFLSSWMSKLGLEKLPEWSRENYARQCKECLELLGEGALSRNDIDAVQLTDPDAFDFDVVLVDEAQDWPQVEAELLATIYGPEKIALADGRDQLLRGAPTDWNRGPARDMPREDRSLSRCLRMKRNLGIFANDIARAAGLNWEVEPNDEAGGGRVIVLKGSYADNPALVERLINEARAAKNAPIDFLHCVPPADVTSVNGTRRSQLAMAFETMGYETWDGTDSVVRRDFPRSLEQLRVLQYESARGLEGWTTVLERVDEAWSQKRGQLISTGATPSAMSDPARAATSSTWRWLMIALTRPIDTLVISLADLESEPARVFLDVAGRHPDFVEIAR
ncbi:AAA domain-containing protein [Sphingomonas aurantiaca]|uniref:AAA domain-containing protein n=1 Tax=Sphingomonas aurantiaca TaxID=185949 RepID=A0A2T5GP44_9SPHN|nr:DEAD/DEAH box helicase family protein [Sphingomonas aurantiaca]PTQ61093.1 AAA domain-containing protein [Sphingomonas aurantiaca]